MAEKVLMLALSPTMETGTIAKWNKNEGDTIESGDILCEVETDKAVMDYESTIEGVLLKIILSQGGEAQVGDTIAIIGEEGEDITDLVAEVTAPKAKPEKEKVTEEKPEKVAAAASAEQPTVPSPVPGAGRDCPDQPSPGNIGPWRRNPGSGAPEGGRLQVCGDDRGGTEGTGHGNGICKRERTVRKTHRKLSGCSAPLCQHAHGH